MKKCCVLLVCVALALSIIGCGARTYKPSSSYSRGEVQPDMDGNPYTTHIKTASGEVIVEYDYEEAYDKLKMSEKYTSWGRFGEDGITWVKKSDYSGVRVGYIDYKGNEIVPLTSELEGGSTFENGYAIVDYAAGIDIIHGIIDKTGNLLVKYKAYAITEKKILSNGNIVFDEIEILYPYKASGIFLWCNAIKKMVHIPGDFADIDNVSYSEGWTKVYVRTMYGAEPAVKFFDDNGRVALSIDINSNEYYKNVMFVEDFWNGTSYLTFFAADKEYYRVKIDKTGKWLDEPERVSKLTNRFH